MKLSRFKEAKELFEQRHNIKYMIRELSARDLLKGKRELYISLFELEGEKEIANIIFEPVSKEFTYNIVMHLKLQLKEELKRIEGEIEGL